MAKESGRTTSGLLTAALLSALTVLPGCASINYDGEELADFKRAQRHELYTACFNQLYDPANPYHNMFGMQRACSRYAKATVP